MKNNYFKYYKPNAIIGFIVILGTLVGFSLTFLIDIITNITNVSYYQYSATSTVIILLIAFIDKKLWCKKPFKYLFIIPNLSGRYEGWIKYQHPITKIESSKKCTIEIYQTGSKVKLNCYFQKENGEEKTPSKSLIETVVKNDDNTFSLVFNYQNDGILGKFSPHHGTNILKFIKNSEGQFLKGIYYTNREPYQTRGEMEVKFITNKLKNDY